MKEIDMRRKHGVQDGVHVVSEADDARRRAASTARAAQAAASRPMPAPVQDPLEGLLPALGFARGPVLPPSTELVEHDAVLAGLIDAVHEASAEAGRAARAYQAARPGGRVTVELVARRDAAAVVEHLQTGQYQAFGAAVSAQADLDDAVADVRVHARGATELRERLDSETDDLVEVIRDQFVETKRTGRRGSYEGALELCAQWRRGVALYRWLVDPSGDYRAPVGHAIPRALAWAEHEAALAVGEQRYELPLDADDMPCERRGADAQPAAGLSVPARAIRRLTPARH